MKLEKVEMNDVEMLRNIKKDTHEVGKICYKEFSIEKGLATGRLMNTSYRTAIMAMRVSKHHYAGDNTNK